MHMYNKKVWNHFKTTLNICNVSPLWINQQQHLYKSGILDWSIRGRHISIHPQWMPSFRRSPIHWLQLQAAESCEHPPEVLHGAKHGVQKKQENVGKLGHLETGILPSCLVIVSNAFFFYWIQKVKKQNIEGRNMKKNKHPHETNCRVWGLKLQLGCGWSTFRKGSLCIVSYLPIL